MIIANILFQQHKLRLYTWTTLYTSTILDGPYQNQIIILFAAKDGEAPYSQQKQDLELTVAQIISSLLQNSDSN